MTLGHSRAMAGFQPRQLIILMVGTQPGSLKGGHQASKATS